MTEKKIIAVVCATGAQGGGLVRAILADAAGPFTARALTRNVDSDPARALAAQGAVVVEVDLDDETGLREAFDGAYGAYVVTNFWVQRTPEQERARSRADGTRSGRHLSPRSQGHRTAPGGVVHPFGDTRPHFQRLGIEVPDALGSYKVPHFDAKGEANAFFTALGVPTTFLQTTFYYEAFLQGQGPHRDDNGELVLSLPMADKRWALIAGEDIGKTALGVFRRGDEFIGKSVSIAGTLATGEELSAMFTAALGEKVIYRPITTDAMQASGQPGALETANMFQFYSDASEYFTRVRNLDLVPEPNPRTANPGLLADPARERDPARLNFFASSPN